MEEIMSIRDYLAKSQGRFPIKATNGRDGRDADKEALIDIPSLKVFERALLLPTEQQCEPQLKKYPKDGDNLLSNPAKKKKKGKGKGKGKGKKKR